MTNSGNVDLTDVGVTDNPQPPAGPLTTGPTCQSLANPSGTCSGATTSLVPGQEAVFTATYVVTQADVDHGSVVDHGHGYGHDALRRHGERHVQHGDGDRDTVAVSLHHQVGIPHDRDGRRPERDLHLQRRQHRQRDPDLGGSDRRPDVARGRGHRNLPEPHCTRRHLLGRDDDP